MHISRQIGSTNREQMELILNFINSFDVNRLLYAINGKQLDEDEIDSLRLDIQEQNVKLERQKKYLFNFGKTFNKKYTTVDNKYFDSSYKLATRMHSGTKGIKKVFARFCKISRKNLLPGQEEPQAINKSMITTKNYIVDLFGLSSYPDSVKELFKGMLDFYANLDDCIREAIRVLKEESDTRSDSKKCLQLFLEACRESRQSQLHIIEAMEDDPDFRETIMKTKTLTSSENNPVLKDWKNSKTEELFAVAYFHNCSPKDVGKITINKAIMEADDSPECMSCMTIFNCTKEKALVIIKAIKEFDTLIPPKCKRGKLPARYLFAFKEWCGMGIGVNSFLNYFKKLYMKGGGKWGMICSTALSGVSRNKNRDEDPYEQIKKELFDKLDKMASPENNSEKQIS